LQKFEKIKQDDIMLQNYNSV